MNDTALVADLLIAVFEGVKQNNKIKQYYYAYKNDFHVDSQ